MNFEIAEPIIVRYHSRQTEEYSEGKKYRFLLDATEALEIKTSKIFNRYVLNVKKAKGGAYCNYQSLEMCFQPILKRFKSRHSLSPNLLLKKGSFYYLEIKLPPFFADLPYLEAQWRQFFVPESDHNQVDFKRYEWNDPQLAQTLNIESEISQLQAYFDQENYEVIPSSFLDQEWKGMPRQFRTPLIDEFSRDPATYRDFLMPGINSGN